MNIQWSLNEVEWRVQIQWWNARNSDFQNYYHLISGGRNVTTGTTVDLIVSKSARMGATSMNEIKSIKQYSKLISIENTGMNKVARHFEDLEYLNTINIQYSEILFNVTERGYSKLHPPESMVLSFGKSIEIISIHLNHTSQC